MPQIALGSYDLANSNSRNERAKSFATHKTLFNFGQNSLATLQNEESR